MNVTTAKPSIIALTSIPVQAFLAEGNHPPVAVLEGPRCGYKRQLMEFRADCSYDPDGDEINISWYAPGAKIVERKDKRIKVFYERKGVYYIRIIATDEYGARSTAKQDVIIFNRFPVARIIGPRQVPERTLVELDGRTSYDPNGDPLEFYWYNILGRSRRIRRYYGIGDHTIWFIVRCNHWNYDRDITYLHVVPGGTLMGVQMISPESQTPIEKR